MIDDILQSCGKDLREGQQVRGLNAVDQCWTWKEEKLQDIILIFSSVLLKWTLTNINSSCHYTLPPSLSLSPPLSLPVNLCISHTTSCREKNISYHQRDKDEQHISSAASECYWDEFCLADHHQHCCCCCSQTHLQYIHTHGADCVDTVKKDIAFGGIDKPMYTWSQNQMQLYSSYNTAHSIHITLLLSFVTKHMLCAHGGLAQREQEKEPQVIPKVIPYYKWHDNQSKIRFY